MSRRRFGGGPGVFVGQVPCAGLPGGSLDVPSCYYANLGAFVSRIQLAMNATTVQQSGSTGVVLFPVWYGYFKALTRLLRRLGDKRQRRVRQQAPAKA